MAAGRMPTVVGRPTRIEAAPQVADAAAFGAITRDGHPIHVDEEIGRAHV